jgi:hypothetical protein
MTQRRSPEEIKSLVEDYRKRGSMTRRAFCESRGVSLSTLGYYLRHCSQGVVRLAKVKIAPVTVEARGGFALVLSSGRRIECDEAGLAQLIRIAEGA